MKKLIHATMYTHKLMFLRAVAVLLVALAGFVCGKPAAAQSMQPAAAAQTPSNADPALNELQKRFQRLFRSIQARGSITDDEKPFITAMLEDISTYRATHPTNRKALAMETQLSILMKDDDRVFSLFDQLMQADPSNDQLAQDWLTYFRDSDNPKRADDVINRIIAIGPESDALRRIAAEHLRQTMQYGRAVELLKQIKLDPNNNPNVILMLSDALYAENRFQESLDILNSVPAESLTTNPSLKSQIDTKRPDRQEYVELWAKEQELRSAEAAADDLPRVEIITSKGRIVAELFENEAPNTVANFITLTDAKFYNGTAFHRVLPNFMAQGGDPFSKEGAQGVAGTGDPGYRIPDEHDRPDRRDHFSGYLSMAKSAAPNTAGSGFYITFEPTPWLNGQHTVFGVVTEGNDIVRQIKQEDRVLEVNVLRKRDHEYKVTKIPLPGQELPTDSTGETDESATDDANSTSEGDGDENAGDDEAAETEQP